MSDNETNNQNLVYTQEERDAYIKKRVDDRFYGEDTEFARSVKSFIKDGAFGTSKLYEIIINKITNDKNIKNKKLKQKAKAFKQKAMDPTNRTIANGTLVAALVGGMVLSGSGIVCGGVAATIALANGLRSLNQTPLAKKFIAWLEKDTKYDPEYLEKAKEMAENNHYSYRAKPNEERKEPIKLSDLKANESVPLGREIVLDKGGR